MREYYYEGVYILRPTLSEEETEKAIEKVNKAVEKFGGKVLKLDKWGKRQLAYPINDYQMGYYVLFYVYTQNGELVKNMERFFRINEDVIRFLFFRLKPKEVKELLQKLSPEQEAKPSEGEENGQSQ